MFVDVETGVNTAISKVRQALRDSPEAPSFVETVPGRGYRFIAPVEVVPGAARERFVPPFAMALVHAGLGEREAVFEWLDKAYAARAYRADPRFAALLARCGFTPTPVAMTQ